MAAEYEDKRVQFIISDQNWKTPPGEVQYRLVGRESRDTLYNKTLLDPSNRISASAITVDGTPLSITGTPTTGQVLTYDGTELTFADGGGTGFATGLSIAATGYSITGAANAGTSLMFDGTNLVLGATTQPVFHTVFLCTHQPLIDDTNVTSVVYSSTGSPGNKKQLIVNTTNFLTIDGVALAIGTRILVRDQTTGTWNYIYYVTSRSSTQTILQVPLDAYTIRPNDIVYVHNGVTQRSAQYTLVNITQPIFTTPYVFVRTSIITKTTVATIPVKTFSTYIGENTGVDNGQGNTHVGYAAGQLLTMYQGGSQNTFLGHEAGKGVNGINNIFIGQRTGKQLETDLNKIRCVLIGNGLSLIGASQQCTIVGTGDLAAESIICVLYGNDNTAPVNVSGNGRFFCAGVIMVGISNRNLNYVEGTNIFGTSNNVSHAQSCVIGSYNNLAQTAPAYTLGYNSIFGNFNNLTDCQGTSLFGRYGTGNSCVSCTIISSSPDTAILGVPSVVVRTSGNSSFIAGNEIQIDNILRSTVIGASISLSDGTGFANTCTDSVVIGSSHTLQSLTNAVCIGTTNTVGSNGVAIGSGTKALLGGVAIGAQATANTTLSISLGNSAGVNTTGAATNNTLVGASSAATLTTGTGNTLLGASTNVDSATAVDRIAIGRAVSCTQDSTATIGAGTTNWITASAEGLTTNGTQSGVYTMNPLIIKTNAGAITLTVAEFGPGSLITSTAQAGPESWTTPTAAAIIAKIPSPAIGHSYKVTIRNQGANTITLVAGSDVTLGLGLYTTLTNTVTKYKVVLTSLSAVTVQRVGSYSL